jgi:hypothetical protein
MTDTDSFFARICGCGVIHLCFGPTTLNLSAEAFLAVTETLKELSAAVRFKRGSGTSGRNSSSIASDVSGTVIQGHFPVRS